MIDDVGFLPGLLVFFALSAIGYALLSTGRSHQDELKFQQWIFLFAFLVRFLFSIATYEFGLIDILKDEDGSGWTGGVTLYEIWQQQGVTLVDLPFALIHNFTNDQPGPDFLRGLNHGYFYYIGTLFYLTGCPQRLPAAVLNCFCGALTVVVTYRIARELFSRWVAERASWWTCLFPSMIVWSAMTIKEPIIIVLEVLALYACVRMVIAGPSFKYIALCAVLAIQLYTFRFYVAFLVLVAAALAIALPKLLGTRNRALTLLVGLTIVPALTASTGYVAYRQMQTLSKVQLNVQRVKEFKHYVSKGGETLGAGSGVDMPFDMSTPSGFALGLVYGAAHLLLAPFPWQLGGASLRMVLTSPELIYWWYLFVFGLVPGLWFVLRKRLKETWVLFFFIGTLGVLYSTMFGNVGLVFRQRAQLLPYLFIIAACGLEQSKQRRAERRKLAQQPLSARSPVRGVHSRV